MILPELRDRVVLVTGGANGIGAAIVRAFHAQGAQVFFCDTEQRAGLTLAKATGPNAHFARVDLLSEQQIVKWIGTIRKGGKPIHALINNAARDPRIELAKTSVKDWDQLHVAETESEANEKYEYMQSLIHPIVAREILSTILGGFDLSTFPFDGPLPEVPMTAGSQSTMQPAIDMARRENLSIRQVAMRMAGARGKSVIKGTPKQIADHIQHWFEEEAADGFNVMPPFLPGGLDDFVALVIPELQRRGLFRTEYAGRTLREHLGLPRPPSRYAIRADVAAE